MMARFNTFDEACIYAGLKRSDGYFAEVIHQNVGHMWGAGMTQGFPVIVSDERLPEDELVEKTGNTGVSELSKMVGMLALCGAAGFVLFLLFFGFLIVMAGIPTLMLLPIQGIAKGLMGAVALFAALWFMLHLTRVYNRPEQPLYEFSRFIIGVITWALAIVQILLSW